jgi:hypothetical protein
VRTVFELMRFAIGHGNDQNHVTVCSRGCGQAMKRPEAKAVLLPALLCCCLTVAFQSCNCTHLDARFCYCCSRARTRSMIGPIFLRYSTDQPSGVVWISEDAVQNQSYSSNHGQPPRALFLLFIRTCSSTRKEVPSHGGT